MGSDGAENKSNPMGADRSADGGENPSLDEAVDSLFTSGFHEPIGSSDVTSGDEETDLAIDLAVDTLFVEDPGTAAPETAELDASVVDAPGQELEVEKFSAPPPPSPAAMESPSAPQAPPESAPEPPDFELETDFGFEFDEPAPDESPAGAVLEQEARPAPPPPAPVVQPDPKPPTSPAAAIEEPVLSGDSPEALSLRKLQEAILTLEWEISRRSVAALTNELQKVRSSFQDDVTVDFAALTMRVVLDYVVKRMSRAHPESIRFLLEVTGFLRGNVTSGRRDPLGAFHQILTRYESYKSIVRKAEGIPDVRKHRQGEFEIRSPKSFAKFVKIQADSLSRAGDSLARRIGSAEDPENLIRSFRFLVTRCSNRILDSTRSPAPRKSSKKRRS